MKRLIVSSILPAMLFSLSASAARIVQTDSRLAHSGDIEACINEVTRACDGHFSQELTRTITSPLVNQVIPQGQVRVAQSTAPNDARGNFIGFSTTDILDKGRIKAALFSIGVKDCGHFTNKTGISGVELFLVANKKDDVSDHAPGRVLAFHTSSNIAGCSVSQVTLPAAGGVTGLKVAGNRAWMTSATGRVFFMNANSAVEEFKNEQGQPYSNVSKVTADTTGNVKLLSATSPAVAQIPANASIPQSRSSFVPAAESGKQALPARNTWTLLLR